MKNKIKLNRNAGPIVFLGTMNAMPMMYAIELRRLGYEVLYFVDVPRTDLLSRPECHFDCIKYPYPDWIIEFNLPSQILLCLIGGFLSKMVEGIIRKHTKVKPQVIFLNGFFISISSALYDESVFKVALTHGSDLDSWACIDNLNQLTRVMKKRSFFKLLPSWISEYLIKKCVFSQFNGFLNVGVILYFPKGFNAIGDGLISKFEDGGVRCCARYDISFEVLRSASRSFKKIENKMIILSAVRFQYKSFPEGNEGYSKGNDTIIRGLADYYLIDKNIEVHFFEKGEDVDDAKRLCKELGISDVVVWHKQMPFLELLNLYENSDVCFDQIGSHWISAVGCYALYLGKPLIANDEPAVKNGVWPKDNPIFSATSPVDVSRALKDIRAGCYDVNKFQASKIFAEHYLGPRKVLDDVFEGLYSE